MLKSRAVDIAFASSPSDPGLSTWPCFATHSVFVAGSGYDCDFDHLYTRQEIADFPLILLERKASSRVFLEQYFLQSGITLSPRSSSPPQPAGVSGPHRPGRGRGDLNLYRTPCSAGTSAC